MLQLVPLKECEEVIVTNEEKLGIMRIDWFDGMISNKWFPTDKFQMLCQEHQISIPILQAEINEIMFNLLKNFSTVICLCKGNSYQHECTYYVQGKQVNYYIKLIPVADAYSAIIVYV
ncbi:hypothetical protein PNU17_12290 [Turicibacter sanguinis]|uniref:hypothetical protein n=1 Tax=Turicibacter sanguinis TaxID=154288 RepID=UPI00189BBF25|nr:hypothetical protein [Turicibacter sanguinis]MDB8556547.1 hypothetical protein [Turicibacter sanguinis]